MTRHSRERGVTLIELIVVLVVITIVAGITIPLVSDTSADANRGARVSNINAANTAITQFGALNSGQFPTNWDSLLIDDSTVTDLLAHTSHGLAVSTLTAGQAASLNQAGLTSSEAMQDRATAGNPTFDYYAGTQFDLTDSAAAAVAIIPGATVNRLFNGLSTDTYIALGLGSRCTAVGTTLIEGPVVPPAIGGPNDNYGRVVAIFRVGTSAADPATFEGCAHLGPVTTANPDGWVGTNGILAN